MCVTLCRCELNHSVLPIPDTGSEERLQPRSESRLPDTSPAACAVAAPNPRRVQPPPEKPTTIQRARGQSGTTSLCKNLSWLWRAFRHVLYEYDCIFKPFILSYNNFCSFKNTSFTKRKPTGNKIIHICWFFDYLMSVNFCCYIILVCLTLDTWKFQEISLTCCKFCTC